MILYPSDISTVPSLIWLDKTKKQAADLNDAVTYFSVDFECWKCYNDFGCKGGALRWL